MAIDSVGGGLGAWAAAAAGTETATAIEDLPVDGCVCSGLRGLAADPATWRALPRHVALRQRRRVVLRRRAPGTVRRRLPVPGGGRARSTGRGGRGRMTWWKGRDRGREGDAYDRWVQG